MSSDLSSGTPLSASALTVSTGKHMICEIQNIQNQRLLHSLSGIRDVIDSICMKHDFTVLGKLEHQFSPQGCSLVYLLSESHISVHTFPEKNYIAMDVYTCREYPDNSTYERLYDHLVRVFDADPGTPMIVDRGSASLGTESGQSLPTRM